MAAQATIALDAEETVTATGFRLHLGKFILTWLIILLSLGFVRLIFYWKPNWYLHCTHVNCDLAIADTVLVSDQYEQLSVRQLCLRRKVEDGVSVSGGVLRKHIDILRQSSTIHSHANLVTESEIEFQSENVIRFFTYKKLRFYWSFSASKFERLTGLEDGVPCSYFYDSCHGLSAIEQAERRVYFDHNKIIVRVTPMLQLIVKEVLSPFYVFQLFSIILWYFDEYMYYATCIVLISVLGVSSAVYETRKMQMALRNTINQTERILVCRGGPVTDPFEDISADDVVPGDVIEIPRAGCVMSCDAVLLAGTCVVNESMLTGESVPVTKTPLPNPRFARQQQPAAFDLKEHARHVLFCGTRVIQTRQYGQEKVRAVVIRTGFLTAKGDLVRSILYPKALDFEFQRHTYFFIGLLAVASLLGMVYTIYIKVVRGEAVGDIIKRALDLVTIAVPPALPAALTIGTVFAQNRLKKDHKVFCISPRNIIVCGSVNVVCFDKTGTLTEDGMDTWGVVPTDASGGFRGVLDADAIPKLQRGRLVEALASCHSITVIDGEIAGDPLDVKMFESTGWAISEARLDDSSNFDISTRVHPPRHGPVDHENPMAYEVGILRQFTFTSAMQRMSVITKVLDEAHFSLYVKGAPEMIASLSRPETVPTNFHTVLTSYTQKGYRVIALASRKLPKMSYIKMQKISRQSVECDLEFIGLLIMENRLKAETKPVIRQLHSADIRTVMITGDNMLTALSVARNCAMIGAGERVIVVQALAPGPDTPTPSIEFIYADDIFSEVLEVTAVDGQGGKTSGKLEKIGPQTAIDISCSNHFHFAISGRSFAVVKQYFPDLIRRLAVRASVCARFSPDQKKSFVETLQNLGYYVSMCGDGANDCGALKAAHAGISLSEAEASVASPFTSQRPTIECVPAVIRQGRASLVTAFGIFKYMASYSLTQFISVLLLYWFNSNLSDWQFLYIDMFIITSLGVTFSWTHAHDKLSIRQPPVSLIHPIPIASVFLNIFVIGVIQVTAYALVINQNWLTPAMRTINSTLTNTSTARPSSSPGYPVCHFTATNSSISIPINGLDEVDEAYDIPENYAVFAVSMFQYLILALVYSRGAPFRKAFYTNIWFVANLLIILFICLWLTVHPFQWPALINLFETCLPPNYEFRFVLLLLAFVNLVLAVFIEEWLLNGERAHQTADNISEGCRSQDKGDYRRVENEILSSPKWPPLSKRGIECLMDAVAPVTSESADDCESLTDDDDEGMLIANRMTESAQASPSPTESSDIMLKFGDKREVELQAFAQSPDSSHDCKSPDLLIKTEKTPAGRKERTVSYGGTDPIQPSRQNLPLSALILGYAPVVPQPAGELPGRPLMASLHSRSPERPNYVTSF